MMTMAERHQLASRDPSFQGPSDKCPYCPTAVVALIHGKTFMPAVALAIFGALISHPAIAPQTESKFRISDNRSRQKRGPPSKSVLQLIS